MAFDGFLLARGLASLVTGIAFAYVARLVLQRKVDGDLAHANRAFGLWWSAFGALEFLSGAYTLPAAFGYFDLALAVTLIDVLLLLIGVAVGALVYYLLYLYTGSRRVLWPTAVAYALLSAALLYLIAWMQPLGYDESAPGGIHYARELSGGTSVALGLVLTIPVVFAALGYGTLYFRTNEAEHRYRIAIVAGSFLAWFGWSTLSTTFQLQARFPRSVGLFVLNTLVTLVVPILIIGAYRPPRWVQRRLAQASQA